MVGPDPDGNITLPLQLRLPTAGYKQIGAKAWTDEKLMCVADYRRETQDIFAQSAEDTNDWRRTVAWRHPHQQDGREDAHQRASVFDAVRRRFDVLRGRRRNPLTTGCIVVPLPQAPTATVVTPRLSMSWGGRSATAERVRFV